MHVAQQIFHHPAISVDHNSEAWNATNVRQACSKRNRRNVGKALFPKSV